MPCGEQQSLREHSPGGLHGWPWFVTSRCVRPPRPSLPSVSLVCTVGSWRCPGHCQGRLGERGLSLRFSACGMEQTRVQWDSRGRVGCGRPSCHTWTNLRPSALKSKTADRGLSSGAAGGVTLCASHPTVHCHRRSVLCPPTSPGPRDATSQRRRSLCVAPHVRYLTFSQSPWELRSSVRTGEGTDAQTAHVTDRPSAWQAESPDRVPAAAQGGLTAGLAPFGKTCAPVGADSPCGVPASSGGCFDRRELSQEPEHPLGSQRRGPRGDGGHGAAGWRPRGCGKAPEPCGQRPGCRAPLHPSQPV